MNTLEKLHHKNQLNEQSKLELCNALKLPSNTNINDLNKALQTECYKTAKNNEDSNNFLNKLTDKTLVGAVGGEFNKKAGIVCEDNDLNRLSKKENMKIQERNSVMHHVLINLDDNNELKITGRIDGYCPERDCIVETKHRRNRLFKKVPEYEKVQCELYMRMFNVSKVYHTETFGEESNETLLEKDDVFWNKILILLNTKFLPLYMEYSKK